MKLQTSCSLHLVLSQPTEISEAVASLIGFLGDQGMHDPAFVDEFRRAAAGAITDAIERGCAGEGDRFVEVTLTFNSLEVHLEIVNPSNLENWSSEGTASERSPGVAESSVAEKATGSGREPSAGNARLGSAKRSWKADLGL